MWDYLPSSARQGKVQESATFWSFWRNSVLFLDSVASVLPSKKIVNKNQSWEASDEEKPDEPIRMLEIFSGKHSGKRLLLIGCARGPCARFRRSSSKTGSALIFYWQIARLTKWPLGIRNIEKQCILWGQLQVFVIEIETKLHIEPGNFIF